jgi:hypothetical protein
MPIVRLVSPAARTDPHTGTDAFEDELQNVLGWRAALDPTFDYTPCWVGGGLNSYPTLTDAAQAAVGAAPNVIVTSGSMATDLVRTAVAVVVAAGGAAGAQAATIAIVQGVGGSRFTDPNITGFFIDSLATCVEQLAAITDPTACILYDATNAPSVPIHDYLMANSAGKALVWLALPLNPALIVDNSTFMLIPSAKFYHAHAAIATAVDGRINTPGANVHAVYPEREYKHGHQHARWGRIRVHGHHVQFTYRQAAHLVDKILRGKVSVAAGSLPAMQEAEKD